MKTLALLLLASIQFVRTGQPTPHSGFFVDSATSADIQRRTRACTRGQKYDAGVIVVLPVDAGYLAPDGGGMLYDARQMGNQLRLLAECEAQQIDAGVFSAATPVTDSHLPEPSTDVSWLGVTVLVGVAGIALVRSR